MLFLALHFSRVCDCNCTSGPGMYSHVSCWYIVYVPSDSVPFLPVPLGLIADVAVINPYSSIACMQGARARIVSLGLLSLFLKSYN